MATYRKGFNDINAHVNRTNNPEELFELTMNNLLDGFYDYALDSSNEGKFKAICLSGFKFEDNTGAGPEGDFMQAKGTEAGELMTIIVRPLQSFAESIPDPKNARDPNQLIRFIAAHKVFTAVCDQAGNGEEATKIPAFGQIVDCYYEHGSVSKSSYGLLKWSPPDIETNPVPAYRALQSMEGTKAAADAFAKGSVAVLGESEPSVERRDPTASAKLYDSTPDIENKANQIRKMNENLHPLMIKYTKAIIYDIHNELNGALYFASLFRNYKKQKEMYDEVKKWKDDGNEGLPPGYGGAPAAAGTSNHNFGFAADFAIGIRPEGTATYNSKTKKEDWLTSGIPEIIERYGLRWGGRFTKNYDPIHFDIEIESSTKQEINKKTKNLASKSAALEEIKKISIKTVNFGVIPPQSGA